MRVLMVVRPAQGGMKGQVLALSRGLIDAGSSVEIAAPPKSDVASAAREIGIIVREIPLVGPLHPLEDSRAIAALRRIVRAGDYDLVHAHGFKAGFVGRLGAQAGHVPFVVTVHNHVQRRSWTTAAAKWRYRVAERALRPFVAHYIAVSESVRSELIEDYRLPADRISVVHNGVAAEPFLAAQDATGNRATFGLTHQTPTIGLAARLATQKGLRYLLAALPEIRREVPGVILLLGGTGPLESELREQAVALEISSAIRWVGHVDDMPAFLSALDVYVLPSLTEAHSLALIEAALARVPIVATDAGGVGEIVVTDQTGLLVPPADPAALARATVRLLKDRSLAERLAETARARCLSEFDPQRMVDRTIAVYNEVLTPSGAAATRMST